MKVLALAGGVGAARLLRGLVRAVPPESVTAIVNTGDDREFYGVHVSPDLDIVTYTLAGRVVCGALPQAVRDDERHQDHEHGRCSDRDQSWPCALVRKPPDA